MISAGCASSQTEPAPVPVAPVAIAPPSAEPAQSASPAETPAAEPAAAESANAPVSQQMLPPPTARTGRVALGSPCAPTAGSKGLDTCGRKGRVSVELDAATVALLRNAACEPTKLSQRSVYQPMACVSEGVLFAGSLCFACRLVDSGWSAKAIIAELTEEQALELQKRLGLDTARALTGAGAWQSAISAAAHK